MPNKLHPLINRRLVNLILIFAAFIMISFFFASESYFWNIVKGIPYDFWEKFQWNLVRWLPLAFLTPLIIRLVIHYPLDGKNWRRSLPLHIGSSLLLSVLQTLSYYAYCWIFVGGCDITFILFCAACVKFGHFNLLTYWFVIGVYYLMNYYRLSQERELRTCRLESQLTQAQLNVLKMQLHPHFLFNTLHAISALVHKNPGAADQMIGQLSDLLRLTLKNSNHQEVPLKEELEFLHIYLDIQKTRFQERLTVNMDIKPETLDAQVPNLILQPLVENAVRHGISPRRTGGVIDILSRHEKEKLVIRIRDDGIGFQDINTNTQKGMGIQNTVARLKQLYGEHHRFTLENCANGGVLVILEIPFRIFNTSVNTNEGA